MSNSRNFVSSGILIDHCNMASAKQGSCGCWKSGKSWNFIVAFSRPGKSWNKATDPGKLWKYVKVPMK